MGAAGTVVQTSTVDEALHRVLPSVVALLRQATGREPLGVLRRDRGELKLSAQVSFPDGVGSGELVATVFAYRGRVRADFVLDHDRVFATQDGRRTAVRCFLNDFQASVTMATDDAELPPAFVQRTLAGMKDALEAVRRHRERSVGTWGAVYVARGGVRAALRGPRRDEQRLSSADDTRAPVASEWLDDESGSEESGER